MRLTIRENPTEASRYVAEYIVDRINAFAPTEVRPFVLGLPTGSSPLQIFKNLIEAYRQRRVSFSNVVTFNMDEYVELPREHPQSYWSFMHTNFFDHVDVDPKNINILNGNAANLVDECAAYEAKIKTCGGIELFLGGVGHDGHIAFNEPGSSLVSRTRVKSLAFATRHANARFFEGDMEAVPRMALTVGVQTIMDAKEVVIIATGPSKALAVQRAIEGGVDHLCTLSCLQLHPRSMIVVDDDATQEMKVKTVNASLLPRCFGLALTAMIQYFKGVESAIQIERARKKRPELEAVNTMVQNSADEDELTPDSMSSRVGWPKLAIRSFTVPITV